MPHRVLQTFFDAHPNTALCFSGGVDSVFLLYAGLRCGAQIKPYFVKTAFQPAFELSDAEKACTLFNTPLTIIRPEVLRSPYISENPGDRCYHCKKMILSHIKECAAADGYAILIDGTNASDNYDDRPGMRALRELEVKSPLRAYGLTKDDIRRLSREANLFTWDKPAYACLATRIPTGQPITQELLMDIEQSESALFSLGFSDFRVRAAADGSARLQVPLSQMPEVLAKRDSLLQVLSPYFQTVTLDLKAR